MEPFLAGNERFGPSKPTSNIQHLFLYPNLCQTIFHPQGGGSYSKFPSYLSLKWDINSKKQYYPLIKWAINFKIWDRTHRGTCNVGLWDFHILTNTSYASDCFYACTWRGVLAKFRVLMFLSGVQCDELPFPDRVLPLFGLLHARDQSSKQLNGPQWAKP